MDIILMIDSIQRIKNMTSIDDNVDDKTILTAAFKAQDILVEPVLGGVLYRHILNLIANSGDSQIAEPYFTLVTEYVWKFLIYGTVSKVAADATFQITNSGVINEDDASANVVTFRALNALRKEYVDITNYHKNRLVRYLRANEDLFPELTQESAVELEPQPSIQETDFYVYTEDAFDLFNSRNIFSDE